MKNKIEIRKIGPKEATQLLENVFEGQRNRRDSHVQRLAEDMRLERFRLSPDAILVCQGKLANGQHRLAAVVESGLAQPFVVMETNDTELYKVLDSGVGRTVGDALNVKEYVTATAAIARLVCAYDKKLLTAYGGSTAKLGRLDILEYGQANAEKINEAIHFVQPLFEKSPIIVPSIMCSALILGERRYNGGGPRDFVMAVYSGLEPDTAAWVLREKMIKNAQSKLRKLNRIYTFALTVKSLKNYCEGNKVSLVRLSKGEPFPEI